MDRITELKAEAYDIIRMTKRLQTEFSAAERAFAAKVSEIEKAEAENNKSKESGWMSVFK